MKTLLPLISVFVFFTAVNLYSQEIDLRQYYPIYTTGELSKNPEFPGGYQALKDSIAKRIHYPPIAVENCIYGSVYVRALVTKTGDIEYTEIIRGVDPVLDSEALRVIKSLPKFTPGYIDGKPVNTWLVIPVIFRLDTIEYCK